MGEANWFGLVAIAVSWVVMFPIFYARLRQATGLRRRRRYIGGVDQNFQSQLTGPLANLLPTVKVHGATRFLSTIPGLRKKSELPGEFAEFVFWKHNRTDKAGEPRTLDDVWDLALIKAPTGVQISGRVLRRFLERAWSRQNKLGKGQGISEHYWTNPRATRRDSIQWGWQTFYYEHIRSTIASVEQATNVQILYYGLNNWIMLYLPPEEALRIILSHYFPDQIKRLILMGGEDGTQEM